VKLYQRYKGEGLVILGINVASDTEAAARKFVEQYKVPYPVGHDAAGEIAQRYALQRVPTTLLINRDGTLFGRADEEMTEDEFTKYIDVLLQQTKQK